MYTSLRENGLIMPAAYCYYRNRLGRDERRLYDEICRAVVRKERSVTVEGALTFDFSRLIEALISDQSMFFYLSHKGIGMEKTGKRASVFWSFVLSDEEIDAMTARLDALIGRIPLRRGKTELQRELDIYDLLYRMRIEKGEDDWEDHCIVGPLLYRRGVCDGMAHLFRLLCCMGGVYCITVAGDGITPEENGPHRWNLVRLGDIYAHVDPAWDCVGKWKQGMDSRFYTYLNLCDRQIRLDHVPEDPGIPECPREEYSYFVVNGAVADSPQELRALVQAAHRKKKSFLIARLGPGLGEDDCVKELRTASSYYLNERQRALYAWAKEGRTL